MVQMVAEQRPLLRAEPLGLIRLVLEVEEREDAEDHGREALDDEHPLPAVKAEHAVHVVKDGARDRPGNDVGDRGPGHEDGNDRAAPRAWEPIGQVQDDAGKEAGLEGTEQEAQDIELQRRLHEHQNGRAKAPAHHDAEQRLARADLLQHQVARHLEDQVADEEDAGAESIGFVAEGKRLLHLQLGEADIDAVEEGDDVADDQERHQPPYELGEQRLVGGGTCDRTALLHLLRGHGAIPVEFLTEGWRRSHETGERRGSHQHTFPKSHAV